MFIAACSHVDYIGKSLASYKYNEYFIFSLIIENKKSLHGPLDMHAPQVSKIKIVPFLIKVKEGRLLFSRYCNPIEFDKSIDLPMFNNSEKSEELYNKELNRINSKSEIEKSCRIRGVRPLQEGEIESPWAFREDEDENENGKIDIKFWATIYDGKIGKFVKKTMFFPPPDVWM
jgi:hypothetical protein